MKEELGLPPRLHEMLNLKLGIRSARGRHWRTGPYAHVFLVDGLVVKLATGEEQAARLAREAKVLDNLPADLPAEVPRPVLVSADPAAIAYPMIDGHSLFSERLAAAPAILLQRLAGELGEFMAALHRTAFVAPEKPATSSTQPIHRDALTLPPEVPDSLAEHLDRWRRDGRASHMHIGESPALIHDDLYSQNLIVGTDGRLCGVIDFGSARNDHPIQDFRNLWGISAEFRDETVNAYVAAGGIRLNAERLFQAEAQLLRKAAGEAAAHRKGAADRFVRLARRRLRAERRTRWRRYVLRRTDSLPGERET